MISALDKSNFSLKNFLILLISLFPFTLLIGSAFINSTIILIDLLFLSILIKEKKINFFNQQTFYLLLFLWISLMINMLLSTNIENSFSRTIGFIRFIIFIFAIKFVLNKNEADSKMIFTVWLSLFLIVTFDIIFETIFGFNTLGFQNNFPGRVSSFLNNELKIGNFYFGFVLFSLSCIFYNFKNKNYFMLFVFLFTITSLVTGERSNFLKIFIIVLIFFFLMDKSLFWKKITLIFAFLSALLLIINLSTHKDRFINQTFKTLSNVNYSVVQYLKYSPYGAHYDTAFEIFKDNPYFGVGLKNFRNESGKDKYKNPEFIFSNHRQTTHPHQLHFEFLAETGLFGYAAFFIFFYFFLVRSIRVQFINKNLYQLSGILVVLITFLPLIPSGSFFTTYGASIFWLNFAVVEAFND
jgi:O-antigen ligase